MIFKDKRVLNRNDSLSGAIKSCLRGRWSPAMASALLGILSLPSPSKNLKSSLQINNTIS